MASVDPGLKPLVIVAIGGNALVRAGQRADVATQRTNVGSAATHLARIAATHRLVVTHGNGPQVGLLALQAIADTSISPPPLDVLDAESVGMIGYLLVEALSAHMEPEAVVAVLTRVEVDLDDPAFGRPTKPVGPWLEPGLAHALAASHGWSLVEGPRGGRRVVASPRPVRVIELDVIDMLARSGRIVIAGGGGGVPVAKRGTRLVGVEAIIDKDLTAAELAIGLGAEQLVVLTDVDAVYRDHGRSDATPIPVATSRDLRAMSFPPGSMGPKIEAVCRFVESTGRPAVIGALAEAQAVLAGTAGTRVLPDEPVAGAAAPIAGRPGRSLDL